MSVNVIKVSKTSLKAPLSVTGGTISVNSFKDSQGNKLNLSDFGEFFTIVIKQGDTEEIIKCDGITQNLDDTADLSVASSGRDISPKPPYDGTSSGNDFSAGSQVICSNDPLIMSLFASVENEQTWQEIQTFQKLPKITAGDPVDDNDVPTKVYVDTAATGGATVSRIIVEGTAGGTIDAGDFIYLDVSDGEWKKTDASNSSTCDNVLLGIAQGNGTDGNAITGGVLIQGKDANQSSLTANNTYYLTDSAGTIATSAGTVEVEVGYAISTSEIYFAPKFNTKLTKDQKDALAGTSGTPSSSNKYVTNDDTEGTGSVQRKSEITSLKDKLKFGGDGSDGDFDSNGSNVTWDAGGNEIIEKNFTSFTLKSGDTLDVTNINTNGCLLWIKVNGDVTISGTIDLDYKGAVGGNANGGGGAGGFTPLPNGYTNGGGGGGVSDTGGEGGGGGASLVNDGATGESGSRDNPGAGGNAIYNNFVSEVLSWGNMKMVAAGAGGGAGGQDTNGDYSGAGGGGAGGVLAAIANTIDTNTGTVNIGGGSGGGTVADKGAGDGGNGAGGIVIECTGKFIFDGTINLRGQDGEDGDYADGGNGANGSSFIVENKGFV